jgi:hypothetical protein
MDTASELLAFLGEGSTTESKTATVNHLTGLTATVDGRKVFKLYPPLLEALASIVERKEMPFAKEALTCFVNLAAEEEMVDDLLACKVMNTLVDGLLSYSDITCTEKICMALSNLTTTETGSKAFVELMESKGERTLFDIVTLFCDRGADRNDSQHLDYISTVLGNITQVPSGRKIVLDRTKRIFQRLIPYLGYNDSVIRRRGMACLIKNCCFDGSHHSWLLSDEINILSCLLLPLAGPEQFDEEDMEKLPVDLQYLGEDKTREPEAEIRILLLESLMQVIQFVDNVLSCLVVILYILALC